jgi:hypothetical protein
MAFPAMSVNWHYYRRSSPEHGWCPLLVQTLTSPIGETSGLAIENGNDVFLWNFGNQGSTYADQYSTKAKPSTTSLPVFRESPSSWSRKKSHVRGM